MFVLQTTENSEKRVVGIQQTKLNSHYKQQNVGNPDRMEVTVMPQIILYEWKIIFSESLFTKRRYPGIDVKIKEL